MKTLLYYAFDRLLSDPLNKRMCSWGLALCAALFFGNLIIHYLILNL
jgi:hypothetical protein